MRSGALLVLAFMVISTMTVLPVIGDAPSSGQERIEVRSPSIHIVDASGGHGHRTIQSAVDNASAFDIIRVYAGWYYENVVVDKNVTIIGNGTIWTIIDGGGRGSAIQLLAGGSISSLSVKNDGPTATAIDIRHSTAVTVEECLAVGGRIGVRGDQGCRRARIVNSTFANCSKAGVWLVGNDNRVVRNLFQQNVQGLSLTGDGNSVLENVFSDNDVGVSMGLDPDRVLLMGNSYTQANGLGGIVEEILENTGTIPSVSSLTSGGLTLADHASRAASSGSAWNVTLNGGTAWDHVVLQDQSQIPGFPTTNSYWRSSLAGAEVLNGMIEETGATTVLMMTWGRRGGDSTNPTLYPNFTVMQDRLADGYRWYAENMSSPDRPVIIAPTGNAFQHIHDTVVGSGGDPTQPGNLFHDLYSSDGSHPSLAGSYLAACVLYMTVTGISPQDITDSVALDAATKVQLRNAAAIAVVDWVMDNPYHWPGTEGNQMEANTLNRNRNGLLVGLMARENDVTENGFSDGDSFAINLFGISSQNNAFHQNGFRNNNQGGIQAWCAEWNNAWDDGSRGNYWSDYVTRYPDANNDGVVWDTPYEIDSLVWDNFPLVEFLGFDDREPPVADAGPDQEVDEDSVVTFDGSGSSDNVGIVSWRWNFSYQYKTVYLNGIDPQFIFEVPGVYEAVLLVLDARNLWASDSMNVTVRDATAPVARIMPVIIGVQFEPTVLDGRSSSDNVGIVNWTWTIEDYGGSVVLYGDLVEHNFGGPGYFLVELRVVDAAGNEAFDSLFVTISDREDPVAEAGPNQEVEIGNWVTLNGSASTDNIGIADHLWSFWYLGSTVLLSGVTVQHYFGEAGMYTIGLRVTDMTGNTHDDIVLIVVLDTEPPVADAGEDTTIDMGDRTTVDGTGSTDNVQMAEWSWVFDVDGVTKVFEAVEFFHFTFFEAGDYMITLTVTDLAGNTDTDTVTINVRDTEPPMADGGYGRMALMGETVTLDGGASTDNVGVTGYRWTFDYDGRETVLPGRAANHTFHLPGSYDVKLFVEDAAGNTDSTTFKITVLDTEPPTVPDLLDFTVDMGDKVVFNASGASDNVEIVRWFWYIDRDPHRDTHAGPLVEYVFNEPGDYRVTLRVEDADGNEATETFTVHVKDSAPWTALAVILIIIVGIVVVVVVRLAMGRTGGPE